MPPPTRSRIDCATAALVNAMLQLSVADAAKLEIVAFMEPWRYEPSSYVSDPALLRGLASGGLVERAKAAELIAGAGRRERFLEQARAASAWAISSAHCQPDDNAAPMLGPTR